MYLDASANFPSRSASTNATAVSATFASLSSACSAVQVTRHAATAVILWNDAIFTSSLPSAPSVRWRGFGGVGRGRARTIPNPHSQCSHEHIEGGAHTLANRGVDVELIPQASSEVVRARIIARQLLECVLGQDCLKMVP